MNSRISIKGMIIGAVNGLGCAFFVFTVFWPIMSAAVDVNTIRVARDVFLICALCVGAVWGGYVAAGKAASGHLLNGALSSFAMVGSVVLLFLETRGLSSAAYAAAVVLIPLFALGGGYLRGRESLVPAMLRKASLEGVLTGGILNIVLTYPIIMIAGVMSMGGIEGRFQAATNGAAFFHAAAALASVVGLAGGYLAARIAKHDFLLNAALSAWSAVVVVRLSIVDLWWFAGAMALCCMLGGYLASRQLARRGGREGMA